MTSKSKNVPELLKEHNNTIPRINKMKPVGVKPKKYIEFAVKKSVSLSLVIMYKSQSRKIYSQRIMKEI